MEVGGHSKGVRPIGRRDRSMKKKSADDVIDRTDFAFRFTILRGSVWAREAEIHAVLGKLFVEGRVIKFTTIITLETLNFSFILNVNKIAKSNESREGLRFVCERKSP